MANIDALALVWSVPVDVYDKAKRSSVMRSVKSKDTGTEMAVRRALHAAGFRYILHRKDLPGKPDLVFPKKRKVIFVHGCFWHQHPDCRAAHRPATNSEYWDAKLDRNLERDELNLASLLEKGWQSHVVWECELKDCASLLERLKRFLQE